MTRWSRRSSTGSDTAAGPRLSARPATPLLLALSLFLLAGVRAEPARAQALQLQNLALPESPQVGPWVRYRVRTQTRSRGIREYTQRVAIVGKESVDGREGFWVELKTEGQPSGTRIERGFFIPPAPVEYTPEEGVPPPPSSTMPRRARIERYQVLQSNGKLYEYPAEKVTELRSSGDVGTIELFEYDTEIPAVVEDLGPDTLRSANRIIPALVERTRRAGADDWPVPGDTTYVNRPLLTQTVWRNGAVPVTGIARSLFQVTTQRVPAAGRDSTPVEGDVPARPDIGATPAAPAGAAVPSPASGAVPSAPPPAGTPPTAVTDGAPAAAKPAVPVISWTDLVLLDLGSDAVPEVTQAPEPLPDASIPESGPAKGKGKSGVR